MLEKSDGKYNPYEAPIVLLSSENLLAKKPFPTIPKTMWGAYEGPMP